MDIRSTATRLACSMIMTAPDQYKTPDQAARLYDQLFAELRKYEESHDQRYAEMLAAAESKVA
jgi:hypothetical protein